MANTIYVLAVLSALIAVTELLVRNTVMRHAGTAILVILVTATAANLGIIPASSTADAPVPVYDFIFDSVAPLAIFLLLLPVNLRDVLKAGLPMITFFFIGSLATATGVVVAMWLIDGPETIGPLYHAIGGMFTGTYSGGSMNFNAVALHYNVTSDGLLYTGAVVIDSILTTVWMVATLAIPKFLGPYWPARKGVERQEIGDVSLGLESDTETVHPFDVSILLGLGFGAVWLSDMIAVWADSMPSIVILTIIALILAQFPAVTRIKGIRVIGMYAVYLFLAVIGAYCDLGAAYRMGELGITLLTFTTLTVLVHGLIIFSLALLFRVDPVIASLASQANIGGGPTALAIARSLGREDLVLPSILIGSLGTAVGTFLGFWVSEYWMALIQ